MMTISKMSNPMTDNWLVRTVGCVAMSLILVAAPARGQGACDADVDENGTVDAPDLKAVLGAWGPCASCPAATTEDRGPRTAGPRTAGPRTGGFPDARSPRRADHRWRPSLPKETPMLPILVLAAAGMLLPPASISIADRSRHRPR